MIKFLHKICFPIIVFMVIGPAAKAQQKNKAFWPGAIWKDNKGVHINAHGGGILLHKGLYYWFGEHKVAGKIGNTAQVGVHCYTSKDLYNWVDAGIALSVSDKPNHDITRGCILERPKVIYNKKTGKFVMWFHLELKDKGYHAARTGLAIADRPEGPYTFVKSYRPNAGKMPSYLPDTPDSEKLNCDRPANKFDSLFCRDFEGGQMARDMTLFVDNDGKAYHVFSSEDNFTLHIAELSDDYLAHTGKFVRVYVGHSTEAPALVKRGDYYYMVGSGCTGWAPNAARWFRSRSIWGPWEYMGNPCTGDQSDITYGGQSTYILPVAGMKDAYIFMADKWAPDNAIDGRYIWLPIKFRDGKLAISWADTWDLGSFNRNKGAL